MGWYRRIPLLVVVAALIVSIGGSTLSAVDPPADMPAPPPLPEDMLNKRPTGPPPDLPDPTELIAQLKQLEELLSLKPSKLQKLRETIEFIEKMSSEEREAMRIRLSQVTRMTDDLRSEINAFARLVPEINKSDLSQFWLAASEEDRSEIRERMAGLETSQKQDLLAARIDAFVDHRDAVFKRMKEALEAKRDALINPEK